MARDDWVKEVLATAEPYKLAIPRSPLGGRTGELMGSTTGSSLEFQDFREYQPGDDPRHIDWAAYARTDTLIVRLYREEVSPRVDIILDCSRSMTTDDGRKEVRARQLALLIAQLGLAAIADAVIWVGNEPRPVLNVAENPLKGIDFKETHPLMEVVRETASRLRRRSLRYVISDFLFPHDADTMVRLLAEGAASLALIQLLSPEESDPKLTGGMRLHDVETDEELNLLVTAPIIESYVSRLSRLQYALSRACQRAHGTFVKVTSDSALSAMCRRELCTAGILEAE